MLKGRGHDVNLIFTSIFTQIKAFLSRFAYLERVKIISSLSTVFYTGTMFFQYCTSARWTQWSFKRSLNFRDKIGFTLHSYLYCNFLVYHVSLIISLTLPLR